MAQPPPFNPVVVLGSEFLVPYQFNILVYPSSSSSSSSFSDGNLMIRDINGGILLKVEPLNTTIHHQRRLTDFQDTFIVTLREKNKTDVSVFMENNTTKECDFKIKGSWSQRRSTIHVGDSSTTIAEMRPWDAASFMVTIQPNVDYAFVVALIATVDAMKCRKDKIVANAKKTGGALSKLAIGAGIALIN